MNLKKTSISALLLAIGLILHQIAPPIFMGMKPDFLLSMMIIAIIISDDYKITLVISLAAGLLTAATTTFPGGQIPNIIDKLIAAQIIYGMYKMLQNKINTQFSTVFIAAFGTIVSGCIFLGSALLIVGLPAPFNILFLTVVIPASIINSVAVSLLYNAVNVAIRASSRE